MLLGISVNMLTCMLIGKARLFSGDHHLIREIILAANSPLQSQGPCIKLDFSLVNELTVITPDASDSNQIRIIISLSLDNQLMAAADESGVRNGFIYHT